MIEKIQALEKESSLLEQNTESRMNLSRKAIRYSEKFLEDLSDKPVFKKTENKLNDNSGFSDFKTSWGFSEILEYLSQNVMDSGINVPSPCHFGYIPGSGLYASAVADFINAVTNRYAGLYEACPGAVRMEHSLISWLAGLAGYPDSSAGDLTSGGSIANLSALVTARESSGLKARDYDRAVIYLTEQTHHSVEKALRIAGLKECVISYIPVDHYHRMNTGVLEKEITKDRSEGRIPWLVLGNAGTTDTGAVDPLNEIADLAESHHLWFHVDGAYGASFLLSESGKEKLSGIERSDSFVIDPHKGLFLPFGSGAVIIRDGNKLFQAHRFQANYMQDLEHMSEFRNTSPAELSPELTRHYRGLRLWIPLKLFGEQPFRAALEEKILLADYFYKNISHLEGIEVGPPPDLSIVIFRYIPETGDANVFNRRLVELIQTDGRVFMSSTMIRDVFTLRFAVLSFRSHLHHVDLALTVIKEMIGKVRAHI